MADIVITETLTYDGADIGDATLTISRQGQEDPDTSDQVVVRVELELPSESDTVLEVLHPDLLFEGQVATVFGANLQRDWSNTAGKVARHADYTGSSYATLEATAQSYGQTELAKLTSALTARQAALDAAG